jgi:hypothetical protein
MRIRIVLAILVMALGTLLFPATASAATTNCALLTAGWGSLPKSDETMGTGEVDTLRVGRHECFDRVVVDIDGPPAGYHVSYVSEVTADGSGFPVTTPGGARLQFIVRHPSFAPTALGASQANVAGFQTLRSVVFAGSFEGQTTYGVGVRARLPFRVFTIAGGHGRIVLDVAHKW